MQPYDNLPLGLAIIMSQNPEAFDLYEGLTPEEKQIMVRRAERDRELARRHAFIWDMFPDDDIEKKRR